MCKPRNPRDLSYLLLNLFFDACDYVGALDMCACMSVSACRLGLLALVATVEGTAPNTPWSWSKLAKSWS